MPATKLHESNFALMVTFLEFFSWGLLTIPVMNILADKFTSNKLLMSAFILGVKVIFSFIFSPLIRAYLADFLNRNYRTRTFGMVILTSSFVISTVFGANLSRIYSDDAVVLLATLIAEIDLLFIIFFIPEYLYCSNETRKMKAIKAQLPLEIWYDLLVFVPRSQLAKTSSLIGDRQFNNILQNYLHTYGEFSIGTIEIFQPIEDCMVRRIKICNDKMPIRDMPMTPIPYNMKNFDHLIFNTFETPEIQFINEFKGLENVRFDLNAGFNDFSRGLNFFKQILPLVKGVSSIFIGDIFEWICLNNKSLDEIILLDNTQILAIRWHAFTPPALWEQKMAHFFSWLYKPKEYGLPMPRIMISEYEFKITRLYKFINRIKNDFLVASQPSSFLIRLVKSDDYQADQEEILLANPKTNERLTIKSFDEFILLSRHAKNTENQPNEIATIRWESYENIRKISIR